MARTLNLDSIHDQLPLAKRIAKEFPGVTFGVVCDPGLRARTYAGEVDELIAAGAKGVFLRPFDSSSLVVGEGRHRGPRYNARSYGERTKDYCDVFHGVRGVTAIEVANEIGPDDPDWIPANIWKCVAAALEVTRAFKIKSIVTGFLEPDDPRQMLRAFQSHPEVKPDVLGISFYPRTGSRPGRIPEHWASWLSGAMDGIRSNYPSAIISEYGSQDGAGNTDIAYERELIQAFEPPGYSCNWNAVGAWREFEAAYREVWK